MKKIILLVVRRHSGEIDWILPLIYRFPNRYKLITIFPNYKSYQSLKDNKSLYTLWKSKNSGYFIIKKTDQLIWKVLYKLLLYSKLNFCFKKIEFFFLDKIFNINYLLKKKNIEITQIKILFTTVINQSSILNLLKKLNPNILLVRFPETVLLYPTKIDNKYLVRNYFPPEISGDIFLFSNLSNVGFDIKRDLFSGNTKNNNIIKKIKLCGYFRYEQWWIKKILAQSRIKKIRNINNILIALRPPDKEYFPLASYTEKIKSIISIFEGKKNYNLIFKLHPHRTDLDILVSILKKSNLKNWEIRNDHLLVLAKNAKLCITFLTSGCLDCFISKKPTIEYYDAGKEILNSNNCKIKYSHFVFDNKKNEWSTIYRHFKFVKTIKNHEQLKKILDLNFFNSSNNKTSYFIKKKKKAKYYLKNKFDSKNIKNFVINKSL